MQYSLHTKWQGVWEIRGNSRWNGERMIIIFYNNECVLTEASTLEEYTLTSEPQSNLKAHWDFRSSGKAQRYYIGSLNRSNYNEIQWSEMRKKRKTDKWIRVNIEPKQYLKQCKYRKPKSKYQNNKSNKRIKRNNNNNNNNNNKINDPAIMNIVHNNNNHNNNNQYQTQHKPYKTNRYYADYYPKPRRTVLRHNMIHEPRNQRDKKRFEMRKNNSNNNNSNKAAVIDAYLVNNNKNNKNKSKNKNKMEWKPKKPKRHNRHRFVKHLTKSETDEILSETKDFKHPVIYTGEISISRFNPNVSYVNVDGLDRDIRISGFIDRNRAFHGDTVVISLYPSIEWMEAIKPEIKEFQNRLDERDKEKLLLEQQQQEIEEEMDDIDDIDEYNNGSSSSSSSSSSNSDNCDESENKNDENEEEIIFFDDSDSDKKKEEELEEKDDNIVPKGPHIKRKRLEDLCDNKSVTAYDHWLFLKDMITDFKNFSNKWNDIPLLDMNHPRRDYINKVIKKCNNMLPSLAIESDKFEWDNPSDILYRNKIARGKVIGIYSKKCKRVDETVGGYLLPIIYNQTGEIDRKWAEFTPLDKRYPRGNFPMRELPSSLNELFYKFEQEEIEIIGEYENRIHSYDKKRRTRPRKNRFFEELKLHTFNMSYEEKWNESHSIPFCHFKDTLGRRGIISTETEIILSKHNIKWRDSFSEEIENYVKENCKIEPETDYINRRDCRSMRVFTIDPTSARDYDDALSIEELVGEIDENGKKLYLIGIHIADVTHFVKENSLIDIEAKKRATSVYLVDRCIPMLPHHLCQNLCSLNPDVDRLSYSIFVILNEEGHLVHRDGTNEKNYYDKSPWFGRTIIRSCARLNYETAHWMLIDKCAKTKEELDSCCFISENTSIDEIICDVKLFWSIAKQMRERRFRSGSVQFFRPHIRFRLDKNEKNKSHKPIVFGPEILLWSNNLIEEMMLLANQLVANQLIANIKEHTLLRKHPSPNIEKGMKLQLICRSQGMDLKYDTPKHLNESLIEMEKIKICGENKNISAAQIINTFIAQSMMRAQYIIVENSPPKEWTHWALNFPIYTHFTSPIRRYADVIVHRLLTYTLNDNSSKKLPQINIIKRQCEICNDRNSSAHFAELDSQKIHLCLLLIDKPIIVSAILIDIMDKMFILVIPGLGIDIRVNIKDTISESKGKIISIDKQYKLPDSQLNIKWNNSNQIETYKLFNTMTIKLYSKLQIPMKLYTQIIDPFARKYVKPINDLDNTNDTTTNNNNNDNDDDTNIEIDEPQANTPPVAMTLDKQLKVGTSDYYASHYD